jgi:hypothetical protein
MLICGAKTAYAARLCGVEGDPTETRCGLCTNCCGSLLSDNALDAPDRTDSL